MGSKITDDEFIIVALATIGDDQLITLGLVGRVVACPQADEDIVIARGVSRLHADQLPCCSRLWC